MDPLTALAAFNASYAVVKTAAQNAGEITDIFAGIGKMMNARKAVEQAAKNDPEKSDLELYANHVQMEQKWQEVVEILKWTGHWDAYEKFVQDRREAERQTKLKAIREAQQRKQKVKEAITIVAVTFSVLSAIGIFFWLIWLFKNKGGI